MAKTLGDVIRRWREDESWTQQQLAERSSVIRSHIAKIEQGTIEDPGVSVLIRLSSALGHSLEELLAESGMIQAPRSPKATRDAILAILETLSPAGQKDLLRYARLLRIDQERHTAAAGQGQVYQLTDEDLLAVDLDRARKVAEGQEGEEQPRRH